MQQKSATSPPLQYSIEGVALALCTHRNTIHRLIASGLLDSYLIGRRRYVRHAELERFLDQAEGGFLEVEPRKAKAIAKAREANAAEA